MPRDTHQPPASFKRLPGWDDRLHRWACYVTAGGQLHSAGVSSVYRCASEVIGSDWQGTVSWSPRVRYDVLEAQQTDKAVRSLSAELRRIVARVYVRGLGGTTEQHARALGMSRVTLHRRLCQIDARLARWLDAQRSMRAASQALYNARAGRGLPDPYPVPIAAQSAPGGRWRTTGGGCARASRTGACIHCP